MGRKNFYTIRSTSDTSYTVLKVDDDFNPEGEIYHISEIGPDRAQMICTCPAGGRTFCRHREMLRLFQAEQKVNSGEFYHYDSKRWVPAPTGDV